MCQLSSAGAGAVQTSSELDIVVIVIQLVASSELDIVVIVIQLVACSVTIITVRLFT